MTRKSSGKANAHHANADASSKKQQQQQQQTMSPASSNIPNEDQRFAMLKRDPRFMRPKKSDTKLVIDKRFQAIFKSQEFASARE
jgi:hypothetical protein